MSCATRTEKSQVGTGRTEALDSSHFDINLIQGAWWREDTDPGAVFFIAGDSLYYTDDQDAPYFIGINGKTFELSQEDISMSFAIKKLNGDSLVFYDPTVGEDIRFFRKK